LEVHILHYLKIIFCYEGTVSVKVYDSKESHFPFMKENTVKSSLIIYNRWVVCYKSGAGSCEQGKELSDYIKGQDFSVWLNDSEVLCCGQNQLVSGS